MPEVRYIKIFKGEPEFDNPSELDYTQGLEKIQAEKFPHSEEDLMVIALIKVEPQFIGEFIIRMPDTSRDYLGVRVENPEAKPVWVTLKQKVNDITFDKPGEVIADLSLDGESLSQVSLNVSSK